MIRIPLLGCSLLLCSAANAQFPPVPYPAENPFSEEKRVLGKMLFWDEQLSSDDSMSCGTCHISSAAGSDPRIAEHPGHDGDYGTDDDITGSIGVRRANASNLLLPDSMFDFEPQVTERSAQPHIMIMYYDQLFWDGRAEGTFFDPETEELLIASGGAMESQAVGPVTSDVEMAHMDRDWGEIREKLGRVVPLALATDLPLDIEDALPAGTTYPELFEDAFGDPTITAGRIGMAIATYERTLIPDQTPFDAFLAGDQNAMGPDERAGWQVFQNSRCNECHTAPLFTDLTFRNIGVRPIVEDGGRFEHTGNSGDRGKFKVPTLRNIKLKPTFMHNGAFTTLDEVFDLYATIAGHRTNRDMELPVIIGGNDRFLMERFFFNGLTDPRVEHETFPFDRPTLYSERVDPTEIATFLGNGNFGWGGVPVLMTTGVPFVGNADFRIGLDNVSAGLTATLNLSWSPPVGNELAIVDEVVAQITTDGLGLGGYGSATWSVPADPELDGQFAYLQWEVLDPSLSDGRSASRVARYQLFCGRECPQVTTGCLGDRNGDDVADIIDLLDFLTVWFADDADIDEDGRTGISDLLLYLDWFLQGC